MAALYCRLSRDDGTDSESNSIGNQRELLRKYARDKGFVVKGEYVDDGISGTTFERDGFKRMIGDIEAGKIGAVLCKDLSRLGRNNAMVAFYTEIFFPGNNIHFVAVNDGIDSAAGDNEIMGFKSIINEWYARDISKKIRSTFQTMAHQGLFIGAHAPYGYIIDPDDHHHLLPDPVTAPVVQDMFEMAAKGTSPYRIQQHLLDKKLLTPRAHLAQTTGKYLKALDPQVAYAWSLSTVTHILRNYQYCGHIISQKQSSPSFKDRKPQNRPKEEWVVAKNMHKSLVDETTFAKVQSFVKVKHRENKSGVVNIFAGMVKCSSCGGTMSYNSPTSRAKTGLFTCNLYKTRSRDGLCTAHSINMRWLSEIVLHKIKQQAAFISEHEGNLEAFFDGQLREGISDARRAQQQELDKIRRRATDLDVIIKRLFEQNALGILSDERLAMLTREYEEEQRGLRAKTDRLADALDREQEILLGAGHFIRAITQYKDITELDVDLLHQLIEKIIVHESEGVGKARTQKVDIHWRHVGLLPEHSDLRQGQKLVSL